MGIIFTLLALIVCTALLAGKLNNGGLNDPTDISAVLSEEDSNSNEGDTQNEANKETLSTADFFYEAISERDQKDAVTMQELTSQIENPNIDEGTRNEISNQLNKLTLRQDKQKTIELNLKNKGYEHAICQISEDGLKADITIKAENIDETESALIQEMVENASNIRDVTIQYIK